MRFERRLRWTPFYDIFVRLHPSLLNIIDRAPSPLLPSADPLMLFALIKAPSTTALGIYCHASYTAAAAVASVRLFRV